VIGKVKVKRGEVWRQGILGKALAVSQDISKGNQEAKYDVQEMSIPSM
jgi:hypothetical protein